ncbi:hypothetical protein Syun_025258 [Stephania yunnanensis]|uniref:Uncharacterized protein n=1 Tax=Stephania yunnanensis TaxID=152371 RepID=A0AAP0EYH6_9MAGN
MAFNGGLNSKVHLKNKVFFFYRSLLFSFSFASKQRHVGVIVSIALLVVLPGAAPPSAIYPRRSSGCPLPLSLTWRDFWLAGAAVYAHPYCPHPPRLRVVRILHVVRTVRVARVFRAVRCRGYSLAGALISRHLSLYVCACCVVVRIFVL